MSEKTKFNDAMIKIKTAFELLETADEELGELGIEVNSFDACGVNLYGMSNNILLTKGLNRVSVLAEKEIRSIFVDESYGAVFMDGFYFDQAKLPVEREDRYA